MGKERKRRDSADMAGEQIKTCRSAMAWVGYSSSESSGSESMLHVRQVKWLYPHSPPVVSLGETKNKECENK